jgi:hypothetical protein
MLLICRSHNQAHSAGSPLRDAAHADIGAVQCIIFCAIRRGGRRRVHRKDAGLPWIARIDAALLYVGGD